MIRRAITIPLACLAVGAFAAPVARAEPLELVLQSRDKDGKVTVRKEKIDPARVGVVVVDVRNYHWCKTATMRVDALVPRLNKALDAARGLGMTVMLCPSDVVDNSVGWPQREAVFALRRHPVPKLAKIDCPEPPNAGGCACGRERCAVNYGWDAMHPALCIDGKDLMPDTLEDVWSVCKERGLTLLIYCGVHTQVCLLYKPMGLRNLRAAGMECVLARDLTDAHPGYDPDRGFTPDLHTAEVVAHFERHLAPTVNLAEELTRAGKWDRSWVVDPVRITPWGTPRRPHLFEREVTVMLSAPLQAGAEIRYTADGSRPTARSPLYGKPFRVKDTTHVRAAAFAGSGPAFREFETLFVRLPERPTGPTHRSPTGPFSRQRRNMTGLGSVARVSRIGKTIHTGTGEAYAGRKE